MKKMTKAWRGLTEVAILAQQNIPTFEPGPLPNLNRPAVNPVTKHLFVSDRIQVTSYTQPNHLRIREYQEIGLWLLFIYLFITKKQKNSTKT